MRLTTILLVLAAALTWAAPSRAQGAQPRADGRWTVKYAGAADAANPPAAEGLRFGGRLVPELGPEAIVFRSTDGGAFSIPANGVTRIRYQPLSRRRSNIALSAWVAFVVSAFDYDPVFGRPNPLQHAAVVGLAPIGLPAGALYPFKHTRHFLEIVWSDGDETRAVRLEIGKRQRAEFLARLRAVTGRAIENWPKAAR